ncbi:hypothetical protein TNCV_2593311 [Trichonephila clavipes]|nr:hypothetical protein TNCV_2593311 [Trichonephila clavipes]
MRRRVITSQTIRLPFSTSLIFFSPLLDITSQHHSPPLKLEAILNRYPHFSAANRKIRCLPNPSLTKTLFEKSRSKLRSPAYLPTVARPIARFHTSSPESQTSRMYDGRTGR